MSEDCIVNVAAGVLGYKLWGENLPETIKFIAVHGCHDNAASFDPLMEKFLATDRCIACVDLPGHGFSYHLPDGAIYTNAFMVQAVRSLTRKLGWTEFHLIGHGYGAWVMQYYTFWWPQDVLSLTYLDAMIVPSCSFHSKDSSPYMQFAQMVDQCKQFCAAGQMQRDYSKEELTATHMSSCPGLTPADCDILMRRGALRSGNGRHTFRRHAGVQFNHRWSSTEAVTEETLLTAMERVKDTPQLYIHATNLNYEGIKEDVSHEHLLRKVQVRFAKFHLVRVKGEHHFHMQQPSHLSDIINNFLHREVSLSASKL